MEELNKWDLQTIRRFEEICERAYRRVMNRKNQIHTLDDFRMVLESDLQGFYADEIKLYKVQKELEEIRLSYYRKF